MSLYLFPAINAFCKFLCVSRGRGMNRKKWKFGVAEHFITKELPHNVTWALSLLFVLALQGAHFGNLQLQGDLGHDIRFLATTVSHSFIAFGEILDLYKKFATLGGYKVRLDELLRALDAGKMRAQSTDATAKLVSEYGNHDQLVLDKLTVKTPAAAGSTREPIELAREISVTMRPGENMLLTGPFDSFINCHMSIKMQTVFCRPEWLW
eukprot:SAG31_NODE_1318_length_8823_cov_3.108780_9_plen_209_part_00